MAKIMSVDYEAIPKQAKQMRAYGNQLNTQLTTAYKNVGDMHNYWYGVRYNSLVKEFNKIITQLNEMLNLVVTEIPYTLETIANNYSQADKGTKVTTASKEAYKKITNITESKDVGMKFVTSNVATIQKSVTSNFTKAKDLMSKIETEYGKIKWQSEASEAFKTQFVKLKNSIVSSFENLNTQFTKLMEQTKNDIQSTETANTVQ